MEVERAHVLLKQKAILSDSTVNEIKQYLDFAENTKPVVKIVSNDERLKAKAVELFAQNDKICAEGFCTANGTVNEREVMLSDYLVVITGAMRMSPLNLTELLKKLSDLNKRAFVIVDKWDMLPHTKDNVDRVKRNVSKNFSMLNVLSTFMISSQEGQEFITIEKSRDLIAERLLSAYGETHLLQTDKLYGYYLKRLEREYQDIRGKANDIQISLEEWRNVLMGMHRASIIKFSNINAEFNAYSKNIFDKISLISAEECMGDNDYTDYASLRRDVLEKYIESVMDCLENLTKQMISVYKNKTISFRESLVNGVCDFYDKISRLQYLDMELLKEFSLKAGEMESVDNIVESIEELLNDGMKALKKKIGITAKNLFDEESLLEKIKTKLQEFNAENGEFGIEGEEQRVRREKTIRKHFNEVIAACNLKVFSETDIYVSEMKKAISRKSEGIVDSYYNGLEKLLIKMEAEVERKYVVK